MSVTLKRTVGVALGSAVLITSAGAPALAEPSDVIEVFIAADPSLEDALQDSGADARAESARARALVRGGE